VLGTSDTYTAGRCMDALSASQASRLAEVWCVTEFKPRECVSGLGVEHAMCHYTHYEINKQLW
jgi:hypothetical protein